MKTKLFFIALIIFSAKSGFSQSRQALLYNDNGQLCADTSLKINSEQLNKWKSVEHWIIQYLIKNLHYSDFAADNGVTGTVILSFNIDSTKAIKDIKIKKQKGWGIEQAIKPFSLSAYLVSALAPNDNNTYTYFISFDFQIINARDYIEKKKSIPIQQVYKFIDPE